MEVKGERDVTDAAAADEWAGAFQFGRSTDGRGKRQAARGPVASQTKENGRRREAAYVELRLQERIRREAEVVIPPTTITHICW